MTRPIKFRGRDIDTGKFVYANLGQISEEIGEEYLSFIADGIHFVDPDSVTQLVGYDCDGNEVYEGDKVISEYGDEVVARLMGNLPPKPTLKEDKQ